MPPSLHTYIDFLLGTVVGQNHCGACNGSTWVTDFIFTIDAVTLIESLQVVVMASTGFHKEVNFLRSMTLLAKICV